MSQIDNESTMKSSIDNLELTKLYYTIGEVADMFNVSKSLIRFWESEFDNLKPHKNSKGDRRFTKKNLEQLSIIFHLVKERGFTLEGAKNEMKYQKERLKVRNQMIDKLESLKGFLQELHSTV